jgi:hypothetical protein
MARLKVTVASPPAQHSRLAAIEHGTVFMFAGVKGSAVCMALRSFGEPNQFTYANIQDGTLATPKEYEEAKDREVVVVSTAELTVSF